MRKALILTAAAGVAAAAAYGAASGLDRLARSDLPERPRSDAVQTERVDPSLRPAIARRAPAPQTEPAQVPAPAVPLADTGVAAAIVARPELPEPSHLGLLPGSYSPPKGGFAALDSGPGMRPALDAPAGTRRYEAVTMPLIGVYR